MLDGKDTLIAFTVPQSKSILKEIERAKLLDSLYNFTSNQLVLCEEKVKNDSIAFEKYEQIVENCESAVRIRESQIKQRDEDIKKRDSEISRQKRHKIIAIVAGSVGTLVGTGFMGYLWVTK
jgi:hypothetical protein